MSSYDLCFNGEYIASNDLNVNICNFYNDTPLHFAAEQGQVKNARLLLKNGANPDISGRNGQTRS